MTYTVDREGVERTIAALRQLVQEGRTFARSDDDPLVGMEDDDPSDGRPTERTDNDGAKE